MTKKNKLKRLLTAVLLSVSTFAFSAFTVFLLIQVGILPDINSKGIFEKPMLISICCAIICTLTGIPGILLHKKQNDYRFTLMKVIGVVLMALSLTALTYSLYLILYYFDIIPNRNLGFMDISHVVAGIVAAPAMVIGVIGVVIYKKS